LRRIFSRDTILSQVTTPEVPHARPDFAVLEAGLVIECKACGLTPVQNEILEDHRRREALFASLGMTYVWWVDRERNDLIPKTKACLENVFYNCKGEKAAFVKFLESFIR
jgi:hypothetical protein